ncbi:MAG: hypothetical protein L0Y56_02385, partial [Nitrospira sp.]|nr:hypothetical protein [Nitrospira sp.]
ARFSLMIDQKTEDDEVVVTLDVRDDTDKKVLKEREIRRKDFNASNKYQDFEVNFTNMKGHKLEFRTRWHQKARIKEHKVTVV